MDIIETKILHLLQEKSEDITISEISENIGADRHTISKRLESLKSRGLIEYRTIGKSKVWKLSKSPFLNALQNNEDISRNMKEILQHLDGDIRIKDKNKTLWSNTSDENDCCINNGGKKCKDCIVDKTFKNGKSNFATESWSKKKVNIITQPITDKNNNTVAVVEIIRNANKKRT